MKLVIDVHEAVYNRFVAGFANENDARLIETMFKQGTVLPKGHGRLIDADALYDEYVKEPEEFNGGHSLMALFRVAPTIIEADTESEE